MMRENLLELANPGHLLWMLYSSQICPFWSRAEARLGKESELAPGAKRGTRAALLGFDNHYLLLPLNTDIHSAELLYRHLIDDIPFKSPAELARRLRQLAGGRTGRTHRPTKSHSIGRSGAVRSSPNAPVPRAWSTVQPTRVSGRSVCRSANAPS